MWVLRACTSADSAVRRLRHVHNVLAKACSSNSSSNAGSENYSLEAESISIGDAVVPLVPPTHAELVPTQHLPLNPGQSTLSHLRWIMQKDVLGQDVFLIGPPGSLRRHLAMQYCELTNREVEYVSLSRDTTESDLKQRREIQGGTAFYVDQAAVRAALEGRILILDGVEKAERNVLPVLNNLLENREMQLEDGGFLIPAARYDALKEASSQAELDRWNLKRVSDRFRVIALGLPVPRYKGNPLDPPLRSRFQGHDVQGLRHQEYLDLMLARAPDSSRKKIEALLSIARAISSTESSALGFPDFPLDSIGYLAGILRSAPDMPVSVLLQTLYPTSMLLNAEGLKAYATCLSHFKVQDISIEDQPYFLSEISVQRENGMPAAHVTLRTGANNATPFTTAAGTRVDAPVAGDDKTKFVMTAYHSRFLARLLLSHSMSDMSIIGPKGCGKTAVAHEFANLLHYQCESVLLYQDMTTRDLLQQRTTLPSGDTAWRPSPLVTAAVNGNLAILDGLHRLNAGTLAVLQRLLQDRELTLHDGTRLLRHDRYDHLKTQMSCSDEEMLKRGVQRIHPSFRVLALAEPPILGSSTKPPWLNPESLTMFLYHYLRPLDSPEEIDILSQLVPGCDQGQLDQLFSFTHSLRIDRQNAMLKDLNASLSTRQLIRISRRMEEFGNENVHMAIHKACMSRFLPQLARSALESALEAVHIKPAASQTASTTSDAPWEKKDGQLRIGKTTVTLLENETQVKVPNVLFYDNPQHTQVMEEMLKDFSLGEHLLLVGNQGVGKNKLVDRFLYLLDRPREYIQLHRDTTVQSLTLQPTVRDGQIVYEDSPLVVALQRGHVLVVDEADKAPTHVTCIMKALVESGEMILGDGRRVVTGSASVPEGVDNVIVAHPNFRLIVLANRPGFPFLGNDFFASLGDMFSCHAIDNPDRASELAMLKQYGPSVPTAVLEKLVSAFGELRSLADDGLISYPYSTREVVNIVKHMQKYFDEGMPSVVRNVFDFDNYQPELKKQIADIMMKHGIPVGDERKKISLAERLPLPRASFLGRLVRGSKPEECNWSSQPLQIQGPQYVEDTTIALNREATRSQSFSENLSEFRLPVAMSGTISISAVKSDPSDIVYIVSSTPCLLFTFKAHGLSGQVFPLNDFFPFISWRQMLALSVVGLHSPLVGSVLIHNSMNNTLLLVDTLKNEVRSIAFEDCEEEDGVTASFSSEKSVMCGDFASDHRILVYSIGSRTIYALDILEGARQSITLPVNIKSVAFASLSSWLVRAEDDSLYSLSGPEGELPSSLTRLTQEISEQAGEIAAILPQLKATSPSENIAVDEVGYVYNLTNAVAGPKEKMAIEVYGTLLEPGSQPPVLLPESAQLVQFVTDGPASRDGKSPGQGKPKKIHGPHLRVIDTEAKSVSYVPMSKKPPKDGAGKKTRTTMLGSSVDADFFRRGKPISTALVGLSTGDVITAQSEGKVTLWQVAPKTIESSLSEWEKLVGKTGARGLNIKYTLKDGKEKLRAGKEGAEKKDGQGPGKAGHAPPTRPKHGKVDPKNTPHVGGNQWAGGTGGRDTAGLGGVGGPYRLDAGHDIHQVPDSVKDAVPPEVKAAARAMALKVWKEKLQEIDMSEFDAGLYNDLSSVVSQQVAALRVIIEGLEAKQKDRSWTRHQTSGDLDDNKLIEGLTGEKDIYRRRTDLDPDNHQQQKPKRLRLVVDVSASMYYFNGTDSRLDRQLLAVLMMLQALDKHHDKFQMDIVGHSGEGETSFLKASTKSLNDKERLAILQRMKTHSQMCNSGDSTLDVMANSVEVVGKEDADEHFVILLSDAEFSRYGIDPTEFADAMTSDPKVNAFIIFIGNTHESADRIMRDLPVGKSFLCMDTATLPNLMQRIFSSSMLH